MDSVENQEVICDFVFLSGDKGYVSISDNDLVINVNTSSNYRVVVYKVESDFSF